MSAGNFRRARELAEQLIEPAHVDELESAWLARAHVQMVLLTDAQRRVERLEEAQATLKGAMAFASQLGERFWETELHVTDAEIARDMGASLDDVLARFRKALAVGRELGALRGELLAAMGIAETLRDAGHVADARAELAPVYAKFRQGFGTPLLVQATTLLDGLAPR